MQTVLHDGCDPFSSTAVLPVDSHTSDVHGTPTSLQSGSCIHITTTLAVVLHSSLMGGILIRYLQWFLS